MSKLCIGRLRTRKGNHLSEQDVSPQVDAERPYSHLAHRAFLLCTARLIRLISFGASIVF